MKKYILGFFIGATVFTGVSIVLADPIKLPNGEPFLALQNTIDQLWVAVNNIQLLPGPKGDKGDKGDQGEHGKDAQHGAGNIAFHTKSNKINSEGRPYLMKIDGTVWETNLTPGWGGPLFTKINGPLGQAPIPVSDIVNWEFDTFVDKNGNFWFYYSNDNAWMNFGPLP